MKLKQVYTLQQHFRGISIKTYTFSKGNFIQNPLINILCAKFTLWVKMVNKLVYTMLRYTCIIIATIVISSKLGPHFVGKSQFVKNVNIMMFSKFWDKHSELTTFVQLWPMVKIQKGISPKWTFQKCELL